MNVELMDGKIIESFLILMGSVGILAVLLFGVKRYISNTRQSAGSESINIVSKVTLQPKSHLFVIETAGKKLLVGVSEKSINLVSDLTDKPQEKSKLSYSDLNDRQKELLKQRIAMKNRTKGEKAKPPNTSDAMRKSQHSQKTTKQKVEPDLSFGAFVKEKFLKS